MAEIAGDTDEECAQEEEEVLLLLLLMRRRTRRLRAAKRKAWSRSWIMRRETRGSHANLIRELNAEDPERFRQYHRLSREALNEILALVGPSISKQDTHLRSAIKPSERLSITLRFLATGMQSVLIPGIFFFSKMILAMRCPNLSQRNLDTV